MRSQNLHTFLRFLAQVPPTAPCSPATSRGPAAPSAPPSSAKAALALAARGKALEAEEEADTDDKLSPSAALIHWHLANLEYANGTQLSSLSNRWWDADDEFDFGGTHMLLPDGYQED